MSAATAPAFASAPAAVSWGENSYGELGDATTIRLDVPSVVSGLNHISAVSDGRLALLEGGSVVAWGPNEVGQLGDGTTSGPEQCETPGLPCSTTPVAVPGLSAVTAIAASTNHSLALLSNGTVMAWGANRAGQLGDGTVSQSGCGCSDVPVAVSGLSGVVGIAAGDDHSLALLSNGTVMAWGANEKGQLGNGTTTSSDLPVAVSGLSGVASLSGGEESSFALLSDGTVMAWGGNEEGELGDGNVNNSNVPVKVVGLGGVAQISAGALHTLAVLNDGSAVAWGLNVAGQLGDGTTTNSDLPVAVSGLSGVSGVSAGSESSYALLSGGAVRAWGENRDEELGTGASGPEECSGPDYPCSKTPVAVCGLSGIVGISAGFDHAVAFGALPSGEAPTVTGLSPSGGPQSGGTSVNVVGTNFGGGCIAVSFGRRPYGAASFAVHSSSSLTAVSPRGEGAADVTVIDAAGISAANPQDVFTYITPPPGVEKVTPQKGPPSGGTAVTITGYNLAKATEVRFGSMPASSYSEELNGGVPRLVAISPAGTPGKVDVTVTTAAGTSAISARDRFTYEPAKPTVTKVSPDEGPATGGTMVTITGTGFARGAGTDFRFGKYSATSVDCATATSCTAVAPRSGNGRSGKVDVVASVGKEKSKKNPPADEYRYS